MSDRSRWALLSAAALLAAVWVLVGGRSLWFDELFGLHAAGRPWGDFVRFVRDHDAHPPAYYLLLRVWTRPFGISELALRALSAVLAVATLAVVRERVRQRLGEAPAAVAVLALAASPLFLQAATEATRYALLTLLYSAAAWDAVSAVEKDARFPWRLAALGALLLYTHYLGAVLVASLAAFAWWEGGRRGLRTAAVAFSVSGVLFTPWLPVLWHHLSAGRFDPPWRPALPATLPLQVLHVVGFGGRVAGTASYFSVSQAPLWVEVVLAVLVAVVVGLGVRTLWDRSRSLARLVACCAGLPAAALLGVSLVRQSMVAYPRYFVFALPFLAVAVGPLAGGLSGRGSRVLAACCGAALLALSAGSLSLWGSNLTEGMGDRRALAAQLRARLQPRDVVLVYPRWESVGVDYYMPELRDRYVALRSEWTDRGLRELREQVRVAAEAERVWVVQGFPIPPAAFEAVYRQLAGTHRVTYFGEFDGVRLTLFVRRPSR
ncbi:MAG: glycosyltransferase family 39 protein [bacterium]